MKKDDLIVELPPEQEAEADKEQMDLPLASEAKKEEEPKEKSAKELLAEGGKSEANEEAVEALRAQLERLRHERDLERQARERAEAEARARAVEMEAAKERAGNSEKEMILAAVENAKTRAEALKREIRTASENGEHERLAELQMEAAKVAARQLQYEDARDEFDKKEKAPKETKKAEISDPFESRIANLSDPSKNWLRQHRECVTDNKMFAKLNAGHYQAVAEDIRPDTPEYFSYLDKHMGYAGGEDEEAEERPAHRERAAAPVTRSTQRDPKTGYIGNGQYQLTREEVAMAEHLGMSPTEYNKWKQDAIKAGRYANG